MPGLEHRIEPVPGIDTGGVLLVRGPNVMKGYLLYANPGVIDSSSLRDGWYDTGDIVVIDDEDFVHIRGRVKRFAKIAGEMVSLEVVEQIAAKAAPGFAHAASTRPDAAKGETIVLFTTSPSLTRGRLSAEAKTMGASELAVPRAIVRLEQLFFEGLQLQAPAAGELDYPCGVGDRLASIVAALARPRPVSPGSRGETAHW